MDKEICQELGTQIERRLSDALAAEASLVPAIAGYLLASGGKRVRPLLVGLCCRLCGAGITPETLDAAAAVELIHTASLLHDDVVDGASLRRGAPSANVKWGNDAAVLVGDFLFARAFTMLNRTKHPDIPRIFSAAVESMAEGEVMQLGLGGVLSPGMERYLQIVYRKTAVLMAAACRCGAILGGGGRERESALESFGRELGMAFQFVDDILDYRADPACSGKNGGSDLRDGKITLPLLYALEAGSDAERQDMLAIVARREKSAAAFQQVLKFIETRSGFERAREEARSRIACACRNLEQFEAGEARRALADLAHSLVERDF
jgi:octaprenyl-diphosphate synthase